MPQPAPLDIDFVRAQFPGLQQGWALFDNAGGTQILSRSVERMNEFLYNMNVQIGGSYDLSQNAAAGLRAGREAMMQFVNAARPEEIAFAASSTVALQNLAASMREQLKPGDEIIVTVSDHESNIGPWNRLQEYGIKIRTWNLDRTSLDLDINELQSLLSGRTRLVAVTYVSNILGTINPIEDIAAVVHENGAKICVDAVALAPHRAIDVARLDVDFLVFSLYKVFGPHFAVMYGKYELFADLDNLYHYFYDKNMIPAKLEPGNASYELAYSSLGIVEYLAALAECDGFEGSMREKIEYAYERIERHENLIAEHLLEYLRSRSDCRIIGRERGDDPQRVPTISFIIDGHHSGQLAKAIDRFKVAVRYGDFHARRLAEYLDIASNGGCLRVSMAHYNTVAEVDLLIQALDACAPPQNL